MSCKNDSKSNCKCKYNIKNYGVCDVSKITLNGRDRTSLNWNEISVPEIMDVPVQKPDIEHLDQVYVDADIDCAKLIETPFSYQSYERMATELEITAAITAITATVVDITPITDAVAAILAIPGLPTIPAVAALQAALTAVTTASTNLVTAVADALASLNAGCVTATLIVTLINTVNAALAALRVAVNALLAAANALAAATAAIPVVGPLVAAAVATLVTAINAVLTEITGFITDLLGIITLIGNTNVLVITPNEERTCLTGRKIIIEGTLKQKVVYTALVPSQTVHSVCRCVPFNAYIIPYASFLGLTYTTDIEVLVPGTTTCETEIVNGFLYDPNTPLNVDLCEEFNVNVCIEDIFATPIDARNIFKNITLFLSAKPVRSCR